MADAHHDFGETRHFRRVETRGFRQERLGGGIG
jgi:hypothetical protein